MTAFTTKSAVYVLIRGFARRDGTVDLVGSGHGRLRRGLRGAGKRRAPAVGLPHHQPGWLHGLRGWDRHRVGHKRCHGPRLRHILYKALLFMGAGAVLQMTGLRKLSDMGGTLQDDADHPRPLHDRRLRHLGRAAL